MDAGIVKKLQFGVKILGRVRFYWYREQTELHILWTLKSLTQARRLSTMWPNKEEALILFFAQLSSSKNTFIQTNIPFPSWNPFPPSGEWKNLREKNLIEEFRSSIPSPSGSSKTRRRQANRSRRRRLKKSLSSSLCPSLKTLAKYANARLQSTSRSTITCPDQLAINYLII